MTKKVPKYFGEGVEYYESYSGTVSTTTATPYVSPVDAKNNRTLQVSANPSELTDSEVVNYFTQNGPIEEVNIPFDKTKNKWNGFLYIVFESATSVDELITIPTKMINGKKALVARKASINNNILNNADFDVENFTVADGSSFTTYSPQNVQGYSVTPVSFPFENFKFKFPMSDIYKHPLAPVNSNNTPSSSAPAGIFDIAGPSGLGGSHKK